MSLFEFGSGVSDEHSAKVRAAMQELNTFLFVRPTEYASTILIKAGYATKSMDVHHKSSNWGPMAGFVPVDPAFSKKFEGKKPSRDPLTVKGNEVHGVSQRVHLQLKSAVVTDLTRDIGSHKKAMSAVSGFVFDGEKVTRGTGGSAKFYMYPGSVNNIDFTNNSPQKTLFCLTGDKKVWWVEWGTNEGKLQPIYVWAYSNNPVTGDYDLWMVAPHLSWWRLHTQVVGVTDEHATSAASLYTNWVLKYLNEVCGRSNNPVFQHGAESQNYGFTQKLDDKLAMITPGKSEPQMVSKADMPKILADIQDHGYMVIWNKRYGELDPHLGSQASKAALAAKDLRLQVESLLKKKRDLKAKLGITKSDYTSSGVPVAVQRLRVEKKYLQGALQRKLGSELYDILHFNDKLQKHLQSGRSGLRGLTKDDFPESIVELSSELKKAQAELQKKIVTASTGGGKSDLGTLEGWLYGEEGNQTLLALLALKTAAPIPKKFFTNKSTTLQEADTAFHKEVFSIKSSKPGEYRTSNAPTVDVHHHRESRIERITRELGERGVKVK